LQEPGNKLLIHKNVRNENRKKQGTGPASDGMVTNRYGITFIDSPFLPEK